MAKYSDEIKEAARTLFIKSWTPKDIAQELNIPVRTIYHWSDIGQWAALLPVESFEAAITRRHDQLSRRENKTALELEEIRDLVAHHVKLMAQSNKHAEKMAEIKARMAMQSGGGEDETGFGSEKKRSYRKNDISSITKEMLDSWASEHLFDYQLHCRANKEQNFRHILKSRQVGMTYYFAFEAFEDAVLSGDRQVFFSASRAQSEIFKFYIVEIAQQAFG
ncbi:terminase gpP N-terminus-related DNA-binding protein, partial [Yersinia enterocolitica]